MYGLPIKEEVVEAEKLNPARSFVIEHTPDHARRGTEQVHVEVPEGAEVNVNSSKFIVTDKNNLMVCGYNNVVSFKDVTIKEDDNG